MKKRRNKVVLFGVCGLLAVLACGFVLYGMTDPHERKAVPGEFVGWMTRHADEASADFRECGLMFSAAGDGDIRIVPDADMLIVTDADGWRFYYQPLGKYGDQLVKVEGSVEKVRGDRILTGSLSIEKWEKDRFPDYAYVVVECDMDAYREIRTLNYHIPEFDGYQKGFKAEQTAERISQWVSAERLASLYKTGKELEEILSGYCSLKEHNADIKIQYTPLYRKDALQ